MSKALKGAIAVVALLIMIVAFAAYYVLGNLDRRVAAASEATRQIPESIVAARVAAARREAGARGLDGWGDSVFERARDKAGEALDGLGTGD